MATYRINDKGEKELIFKTLRPGEEMPESMKKYREETKPKKPASKASVKTKPIINEEEV